jgi:hypothetical protein
VLAVAPVDMSTTTSKQVKRVRYWIPARRYVLNTSIPVSVKYWRWSRRTGLQCYYLQSCYDAKAHVSEYTLPEFERAIAEGREHAIEVTCEDCDGTGMVRPDPGPLPLLADNECPTCDGFGRAEKLWAATE